MENIQLIGLIMVIVGSFLPLLHIPIIGNWNYWKIDYYLASTCWILSALALFSIINSKPKLARNMAILMVLLFSFTLFAIRYESSSYFSFLPFQSWKDTFSSIVQIKWGWIVEFFGAFIIILATKK
ncbi:hypothetical protein [Chryseobacterium sp.]|uniref:hypothetical protein n=1 Tax=Chryseobacterium sp. TaxID=1871047 RepID=UPI003890799D